MPYFFFLATRRVSARQSALHIDIRAGPAQNWRTFHPAYLKICGDISPGREIPVSAENVVHLVRQLWMFYTVFTWDIYADTSDKKVAAGRNRTYVFLTRMVTAWSSDLPLVWSREYDDTWRIFFVYRIKIPTSDKQHWDLRTLSQRSSFLFLLFPWNKCVARGWSRNRNKER